MGGFNMRKHLGFSTGFNSGRFGALVAKICRYFTTLDGTADYYTIPTVSLAGDFEIEFDTTTVQTTTEVFLGNGTNTDDFIASISGTSIKVKIGGVDVSTIAATFNDGKLHNIKVKRVGTTVTTYLDGVSIGSGTSANTFVIAKLGAYNAIAQLFHTGVLSEVKITDGTDLIRYYKIDEDFSTTDVLTNSATTLGSDIVTNGSFDGGVTTGWTALDSATLSVVSGRLRLTNNGANFGKAQQVLTTVAGKQYQLIVSGFAGTMNPFVRVGNTSKGTELFPNTLIIGEDIHLLFTATSTTSYLVFGADLNTDALYCDFDNVSVKQADGYGEAISISSSELFVLEGSDWIGAELVTNGSFATDLSSWVITGEDGTHSITWDNGSALFLSDTTTPALKMEQILSSIIVGCAYKLTHNISVNSGTNTIKYSSAFNNLVLIDGIAEQIEIAANTFYSITRNSVNVDLNINQLSVKRILQAP